jgi:hypothetical protein
MTPPGLRARLPFRRRLISALLVGAGLVVGVPVHAQDLGFVIGFSSTTVSGPIGSQTAAAQAGTTTTVSRLQGSIFGVFVGAGMGRAASLEIDGLAAFRGATIQTATLSPLTGQPVTSSTASDRLIYLDVPVLARVAVGRLWRRDVHLTVGPAFGVLLSARDAFTNSGLGSQIKRFDPAFVVGGGVNLGAVVIQGRYEWSLQNVANGPGLLGAGVMKNRSFHIAAILTID